MRRLLLWLVISLLLHPASSSWAQNKQELIEISIKHGGGASEISTKNQLRRLLNQYQISNWLFPAGVVQKANRRDGFGGTIAPVLFVATVLTPKRHVFTDRTSLS